MISLCVLCVFVVRSTPSLLRMYLRIHFTHQTQESRNGAIKEVRNLLTTVRTIPVGTTSYKMTKGNSRTNRAAVHGLLEEF
ncbi:MAG: hypothetical protein DWQ56_07715 [Microcystis aeruginosa DA14]|uniref:Uncharacterized protein n=1 Tax=Microcystis aeruginosa DA14 TaxID=1987506 RepID=A0A3E0MGN1_MICAE|nr:MAG: hypothetical protein DWQ56_07715 [Microcystis aeruginosa DA14]